MEQIRKSLIFLIFISIFIPSFAIADAVSYFYDDAGRLARALRGTEGLIYQYDAVGNLLSIGKGTVGTGVPVLNSIAPDVLFIGSTTPVTINGQNLFTTKNVTSDNESVRVNYHRQRRWLENIVLKGTFVFVVVN
jgi:hypothetical protein